MPWSRGLSWILLSKESRMEGQMEAKRNTETLLGYVTMELRSQISAREKLAKSGKGNKRASPGISSAKGSGYQCPIAKWGWQSREHWEAWGSQCLQSLSASCLVTEFGEEQYTHGSKSPDATFCPQEAKTLILFSALKEQQCLLKVCKHHSFSSCILFCECKYNRWTM